MTFSEWLKEFRREWKKSIRLIGRNMLLSDYNDGLTPHESYVSWTTGKGPGFDSMSYIGHAVESIGTAVPTRDTGFGIQASL